MPLILVTLEKILNRVDSNTVNRAEKVVYKKKRLVLAPNWPQQLTDLDSVLSLVDVVSAGGGFC